jgi:hypothetical protein
MPVYVDPPLEWPWTPRWPYRSVSHLYADTPEELHDFARSIGLKRVWCSDHTQPDSRLLHYDLSPNKRKQAVRAGAEERPHGHKKDFFRPPPSPPERPRRWV